MSQEEDVALIELLSKILWKLIKNGYIQTYDEYDEADVEHLRNMARDAVGRARRRLGLPEMKGFE